MIAPMRGIISTIVAVVIIALFAGGCRPDNRPAYVAPSLPPEQIVTLKTNKGVFVDGIDGAKVKHSGVTFMGIVGGNTVTLAPGEHAIDAEINTSNFHKGTSFRYTFDAGTTYEMGPNNVMFPSGVEITNTRTGVKTEIN
jgi:hypothetical protein